MGRAAPSPVPMPLPTPDTSPSPVPPMSRSCVPTLDAPFNDASIYGPLCTTLGNSNTCPGPLCRWSAALLSESAVLQVGKSNAKHKKSYHFLGPTLLQDSAFVARSRSWLHHLSTGESELQQQAHGSLEL